MIALAFYLFPQHRETAYFGQNKACPVSADPSAAQDTTCEDVEALNEGADSDAQLGPGNTVEADEKLEGKQGSGAPLPILPHLITMSMLPKTQWQNLVHLDAIKVLSLFTKHHCTESRSFTLSHARLQRMQMPWASLIPQRAPCVDDRELPCLSESYLQLKKPHT